MDKLWADEDECFLCACLRRMTATQKEATSGVCGGASLRSAWRSPSHSSPPPSPRPRPACWGAARCRACEQPQPSGPHAFHLDASRMRQLGTRELLSPLQDWRPTGKAPKAHNVACGQVSVVPLLPVPPSPVCAGVEALCTPSALRISSTSTLSVVRRWRTRWKIRSQEETAFTRSRFGIDATCAKSPRQVRGSTEVTLQQSFDDEEKADLSMPAAKRSKDRPIGTIDKSKGGHPCTLRG